MSNTTDPALEYIDTVLVPGEIWLIHGHRITGVHLRQRCEGRECVIHNPSIHHMRSMDLLYRNDRNIFERICEHGVGHPDPDQFSYWKEMGTEFEAVHGCDGCCKEPEGWVPNDLEPTYACSKCDVSRSISAISEFPYRLCREHEAEVRVQEEALQKKYLNRWETT